MHSLVNIYMRSRTPYITLVVLNSPASNMIEERADHELTAGLCMKLDIIRFRSFNYLISHCEVALASVKLMQVVYGKNLRVLLGIKASCTV